MSSSIWLKEQGTEYQSFGWQNGYGAYGISFSQAPVVTAYILGQDEHHRVVTFQDEFRLLMQENEINFDERYVWD